MSTPEFVLALRRKIGHDLLWMPGVTAIVLDTERARTLMVRRADNNTWTPVTGIIDPGEQPAQAAVREVAEETTIRCRAIRLIDARSLAPMTYANGDHAQYLDLTFVCEYLGGEPFPADGENLEATWFPVDEPPPLSERFAEVLRLALQDEPGARFQGGTGT